MPPRSFEICPVFSLGGRGVGDDEERYGGGGEVEANDAALAGEAPVRGEKNRYSTGMKDTESGSLGDDMRSALLVNFELVGSSSSEIKRRPDWSQNSSDGTNSKDTSRLEKTDASGVSAIGRPTKSPPEISPFRTSSVDSVASTEPMMGLIGPLPSATAAMTASSMSFLFSSKSSPASVEGVRKSTTAVETQSGSFGAQHGSVSMVWSDEEYERARGAHESDSEEDEEVFGAARSKRRGKR